MSYRDDADALLARTQALEIDVRRLEAELAAARGRTERPRKPTGDWIGTLMAKLPAGEQDLIVDLVGLLVTRRDYPSLESVTSDGLEPLIVRLRQAFAARPR
jgi:hypothetical protein